MAQREAVVPEQGKARVRRFDFKKLDVYREAVDYYGWTIEVTAGLSWRHRRLVDQTIGAALSVVGNIGEAGGRRGQPAEVRQHYRYAQGSVHESAAYLDALLTVGAIDPVTHDERECQLANIGSMLTRLIQRETRRPGRP